MKVICEICGQFSENDKRCTYCGAEMVSADEIAALPARIDWGWAVFSLNTVDLSSREEVINYMRERWAHSEEYTQLSLFKSQLPQFRADASEIRLLVREDIFNSLFNDFANRFKFTSAAFDRVEIRTTAEANALIDNDQL